MINNVTKHIFCIFVIGLAWSSYHAKGVYSAPLPINFAEYNLKLNKMELWKDIKGYDGLYQISKYGDVKSLHREYSYGNTIRKNRIDRAGYYHINLKRNSNSKTCYIHRLVALHFIPNPENKPCVNHIDGNKLNNNVNNLEWCTHSENMQHAIRNNLATVPKYWKNKKGTQHVRSKKVFQYNENNILITAYGSAREAKRMTGICDRGITKVCRGERITAGGYYWKYK